MKITKLTAENIKRISAIEIEPNGNVIVVGGVWQAGKRVGLIFSDYRGGHAYPIGENDTNLPCSEKPVLQTT